MNRGIKFRGKRVDNGEWVYGYYYHGVLTDEPLSLGDCRIAHVIISEGVYYHVDPKTVGQFVGLKDKNGVEIYEGDVIQTECNSGIKLSKFIVFYSSEFACFKKLREDGEIFNIDFFSEKSKVVIGNIHDNPDLNK